MNLKPATVRPSFISPFRLPGFLSLLLSILLLSIIDTNWLEKKLKQLHKDSRLVT